MHYAFHLLGLEGVAYLRDDFTDQTINKSLLFARNHSLIQQPRLEVILLQDAFH